MKTYEAEYWGLKIDPDTHEQLEKIRTSEDPRYAYDPQSGRWERRA